MKNNLFIAITMIAILVINVYANDPDLPANANRDLIEKNLLVGLNSQNTGLRHSCALMLGKIKSTKAVIPLMALLKQCDEFNAKRAAAWALCNIGNPRGTYAVKMEVKYNDCCKTRLICAWYYENMVKPGTFAFSSSTPALIAELKNEK